MKVHDKYVIEIEEIIRGYGNNPEVEDPLGVCPPLARIKGFRTLIFDQNGLDKLTPYDPDEEYQRGFDDAHKISVEECRNKYEQGLNDAWDLADDVSHNRGNILDILGCPTFGVAFKQLTASEAIQKLKEYEERKKAEKEIRVGDEVTCYDRKGVVTRIDHDHDNCNVCWSTGETGWYPISDLTKTGRSFPEIVEVLKKMRGEEA